MADSGVSPARPDSEGRAGGSPPDCDDASHQNPRCGQLGHVSGVCRAAGPGGHTLANKRAERSPPVAHSCLCWPPLPAEVLCRLRCDCEPLTAP